MLIWKLVLVVYLYLILQSASNAYKQYLKTFFGTRLFYEEEVILKILLDFWIGLICNNRYIIFSDKSMRNFTLLVKNFVWTVKFVHDLQDLHIKTLIPIAIFKFRKIVTNVTFRG